jgi:hypothetical protein
LYHRRGAHLHLDLVGENLVGTIVHLSSAQHNEPCPSRFFPFPPPVFPFLSFACLLVVVGSGRRHGRCSAYLEEDRVCAVAGVGGRSAAAALLLAVAEEPLVGEGRVLRVRGRAGEGDGQWGRAGQGAAICEQDGRELVPGRVRHVVNLVQGGVEEGTWRPRVRSGRSDGLGSWKTKVQAERPGPYHLGRARSR